MSHVVRTFANAGVTFANFADPVGSQSKCLAHDIIFLVARRPYNQVIVATYIVILSIGRYQKIPCAGFFADDRRDVCASVALVVESTTRASSLSKIFMKVSGISRSDRHKPAVKRPSWVFCSLVMRMRSSIVLLETEISRVRTKSRFRRTCGRVPGGAGFQALETRDITSGCLNGYPMPQVEISWPQAEDI